MGRTLVCSLYRSESWQMQAARRYPKHRGFHDTHSSSSYFANHNRIARTHRCAPATWSSASSIRRSPLKSPTTRLELVGRICSRLGKDEEELRFVASEGCPNSAPVNAMRDIR